MRSGRGATTGLLSVFALGAVVLTACDSFRDVSIDNACGYDIEADNAHDRYSSESTNYTESIPDGGNGETHSSGGPFDIILRRAGTTEWTVTIEWDRLKESSEQWGRTFVVEGDDCPK